MRTLSLGVLIVCGGTLAALPFRRYKAIPDASSVPTQVTGPSESALNTPQPEGGGAVVDQLPSLADVDSASGFASYAAVRSQPTQVRRQIEIPLTYEDLAVPIDQPKPVMQRFSATTAVRDRQREQDRLAGLEMPSMEELPLHQQQEIERVAESILSPSEEVTARAAGRLASASSAGESHSVLQSSEYNALPEPQERQRFWIHQPQ